jgi:hypothetical protein
MEMIEQKIAIYDENGYKETIIELVPKIEIPIVDKIKEKEEELLKMYNDLQQLKSLKNGNS